MLRYYPSFRVKTNLVAGENLFTSANGKPYTGPYYETYDGHFFSGPSPIIGPNEPLTKVQVIPSLPGLSSATNVLTTSGNEFLLDGVPYVGQYYQDLLGNYYAVEPMLPSDLSSPTNAAQGNTTPTQEQISAQQALNIANINAVNQASAAQNISNQGTTVSSISGSRPLSTSSLSTQQQNQTQANLNYSISPLSAIPMNEVITDSQGNKFVRGPENQLIPYETAQRDLQDSKRKSPNPRLLQPIAATLPPPGKTSSGANTRSSTVPLQQQFLFNLKVNPNFTGQPIPYYPNPTQDDYDRGYFFRYFIKKVNQNGYIIEISQEEYNQVKNGTTTYDVSLYQVEFTFWKLTGNLRTVRLSQYDIRDGIIDTNKRFIEGIEKRFVGIKEFIGGQYDKFARPNTSPLNR